MDALSESLCNADGDPCGVDEPDINGDPELETIAEAEDDCNIELEIELDMLVETEWEYDTRGDIECNPEVVIDTIGVSELDEIHDPVFKFDADTTFVIELIGVSDTVDDTEWEDDMENIRDIVFIGEEDWDIVGEEDGEGSSE